MKKGKSINDFPENKELVKLARQILGITRIDLAGFIGYSKQSLYFWEKGKHPIPPSVLAIFQQIYLINHAGCVYNLRIRINFLADAEESVKTLKFLQAIFDFRIDKL